MVTLRLPEIILLGLLLMLLSACASSRAPVLAAVEAYDRSIEEKATEELHRLMAENFVYFTSSGQVRSRDRFIGFLTSPEYRPEFRERSELQVYVSGETAVVASRWRGRGTYAGTPFDDDQRCSLVFTRLGGGWRVAVEHCTPIRP